MTRKTTKKKKTGTNPTEMKETKRKGTREKPTVILESKTFTLSYDKLNWIAEFDGKQIFHSRLQYLCIALLERKLRASEVRDIQGLKDAIDKAVNEICFHVPNAVK